MQVLALFFVITLGTVDNTYVQDKTVAEIFQNPVADYSRLND